MTAFECLIAFIRLSALKPNFSQKKTATGVCYRIKPKKGFYALHYIAKMRFYNTNYKNIFN
jgi:hypothetical protein